MNSTLKTKRIPLRSCVVCRTPSSKKTLVRVVRPPEATGLPVRVDTTGKASGRGAYVCASAPCIERAIKEKRFERALRVPSLPPNIVADLSALVLTEDVDSHENRRSTAMS